MERPQLDLLAFGPHPDDVEICCSGTLLKTRAQGYRVGIVDLTAGEMGTRGSREIRAAEAEAATRVLGLDYRECLDLGDGRLRDTYENQLAVVRVLRACRPRLVLIPWKVDDHPDHEHAALIIKAACFMSGMARLDTGQVHHRPARLLYYAARREFHPSLVVDVAEYWPQREEAARCYRSQLYDPQSTEPQTKIASPDFWHHITGRAMYYGQLIGARYGEAFFCEDVLPVEDLIHTLAD